MHFHSTFAKLASVPQFLLLKMGKADWGPRMHPQNVINYTRPISLDQLDKSTPLFPTEICPSSTYQPTYQFIVVAPFLGLRERAGPLWHCPTTREFMGQCLPNLAAPARASSCSFQNKPLTHKVAFISFPGRRVGWTPPDGPEEMKTSRVRMCAPKSPHGGQRASRRLPAGLLAKGSQRQLHKLPPCETGYVASGEKDVLSKKSPLLSFYARWWFKIELPPKLERLNCVGTSNSTAAAKLCL